MTQFSDLGLAGTLLSNLSREGYEKPTPIQAAAIPSLLKGRDLLGIAQTGTGKTAAFALPIIQHLTGTKVAPKRGIARSLVLAPTRELASQIEESFRVYGRGTGLSTAAIYGGVGHRPQIDALRRGLDVLVATPGRLLDHIDAGHLSLAGIEVFVLDEADQMLDMGFIHAIRRIVPMLPKKRQSLFFSATMSKEMGALAGTLLTDPEKVAVTPVATVAERIEQRVVFLAPGEKRIQLAKTLKAEGGVRTLVFTRTKRGADRVVRGLSEDGIDAIAIHGNKSQAQREKALAGFRSGKTPVLVATDIAARGIDIDDITHIVNFDLPNVPEVYVHRIGRTARAGAAGVAISFCSSEERADLRAIEKLTGLNLSANAIELAGAGWQPKTDAGTQRAEDDRRPKRRGNRRGNNRGREHSRGGEGTRDHHADAEGRARHRNGHGHGRLGSSEHRGENRAEGGAEARHGRPGNRGGHNGQHKGKRSNGHGAGRANGHGAGHGAGSGGQPKAIGDLPFLAGPKRMRQGGAVSGG